MLKGHHGEGMDDEYTERPFYPGPWTKPMPLPEFATFIVDPTGPTAAPAPKPATGGFSIQPYPYPSVAEPYSKE